MGEKSGERGVCQGREKVKKPSDDGLEISAQVSIVYVFKGCPPATPLELEG